MPNLNITKRGTHSTSLGVMISRCSPDSQHGRPSRHPANAGCSLFKCMNDHIINHNDERPKRKTWTRKTIILHYTAILGATLHKETVQFKTHQVGPTKNNKSEINCQLLKMNTLQYQVTQQKQYHKNNRQI